MDLLAGGQDRTGRVVWPAAAVLREQLPALVPGRRVVELGCGQGTVGARAAELGAAAVTLTDRDAAALAAAGAAAPAGVATLQLEWPAGPGAALPPPCDLVLGSDVLYPGVDVDGFFALARRLLAPGGALVISHVERKMRRSGALVGFAPPEELARCERRPQHPDIVVLLYRAVDVLGGSAAGSAPPPPEDDGEEEDGCLWGSSEDEYEEEEHKA